MTRKFIHLHTHSHFSLLQALPKIPELVAAAKKDGMTALALTDNGNLYGAIQFYKRCRDEGVKPIIGIDAYVAARTRRDKEARVDNRSARLVLLAKNERGYRNLIQLVTKSFLEGFYYKPRIDRELIESYKDNLIAIIPSFSGETSHALKNNNAKKAQEALLWYQSVFGTNLFLEITHHPEIEGHEELMEKIKKLSEECEIPLVAAHDVYYINTEDRLARETMQKIQTGTELTEEREHSKDDFSFISQERALEYFKDTPEALLNTVNIAGMCDIKLKLGTWVFPEVDTAGHTTHDDALRELAESGIKRRGLKKTKEITERLEYELGIIKAKGYAPYFLVVADLLNYAHKKEILTTIRGSVAGSLVTYLSGITTVNPLEYKLPFERFLNPERPSAPDIDMDFADNRRDEVIQYAKEKYGEDKVAQIGTFGTMMARGVVRDVARALGHAYALGDRIAKLIPFGSQGFPMTIKRAFELIPELKELYQKEKEVKEVIDLGKKIEGRARHISIHAAGVVIAPRPLTDFVPLQYDPKGGKIITQYDMHAVEDAGLLKFDFLGLKNLAILADVVERVKAIYNIDIDIERIPFDDKKTFEMLARGETMGLFQLNGSGMTHFLKELKPTSIYDINAMVALYRPGPMESIPSYIERKHNPKLVDYLDPRMKDILSQSYGVITYQDDVLLIAIHIAGYSWLAADTLRKAMGKKIPAVMEAEKEKLIKGAIEHGMTEEKAERLWKLIEPFAAYGFNKAHAASYGRVAYQTAYMKAHYPVEYMSAVLSADSGDVEKISESIIECVRMGIDVLPPDINESFGYFSVVPAKNPKNVKIRFGLYSIKNFGEGIAQSIIDERKKNGAYASIANFLERAQNKNLNRKTLEALIKSGALDQFEERGAMLQSIESLLAYSRESGETRGNQDSLFGEAGERHDTLTLPKTEPVDLSQKLMWEKELLGLYVSGHPLQKFKHMLEKQRDIEKTKKELREGMPAVVYGIIEEARPILTKKGEQMSFVRIADFSGNIEVVIFPKLYAQHKEFLSPEKCIGVKGRLSARNGEVGIVAEALKAL
ncbi:DNA polymerase III subunit alpha [Candidatus Kaiserbacteria bacterium]|nr:DNA polymerase III subunit alpha [Candidatus Kaiserbacteria bacterium]